MRTIAVQSGNYDVTIGPGLLAGAGDRIAEATRAQSAVVVTDDNVGPLYLEAVAASLKRAGISSDAFAFPHGERSKALSTLSDALEFFAENRLTRSDAVVALGGGVVGDLAGFAAAVYARGVQFVQIPTTLLAAVDSSVGGKTAVDLRAGKNLAGAFHFPKLVLCDTGVIARLPEELLRDGAAEMVKAGVLKDRALFDAMADGSWRADLERWIARCVEIKRDCVDLDPFDRGERQLLNLGHTFGHAVEACSGFSITHGGGVAIGLRMAFRAAGLPDGEIVRALAMNGLPTECPYGADELFLAATLDKKRRGEVITLVLPEEIGRCVLKTVPVGELLAYIRRGLGEGA